MELINTYLSVLTNPKQETAAVLLSVAGAIVGVWLSAAANRRQFRKQHTVNVLMDAGMNHTLIKALRTIVANLEAKECPSLEKDEDKKKCRAFALLLNHYEFIAAGLRNGDFDEMLVYDSECRNILRIYQTYLPNIRIRQEQRQLGTLYEHLAWLNRRWSGNRPMTFLRAWQIWRS